MKRRLLIIAIFLLLGAVVNVATTWACALWIRAIPNASRFILGFSRNSEHYSYWLLELHIGRAGVWVSSQWSTTGSTVTLAESANTPEELLPPWAGFVKPDEAGSPPYTLEFAEASGWPMLAMWSGREFNPDVGPPMATIGADVNVKCGYLLPQDRKKRSDLIEVVRVLPLAPIWPGFAVNTIFYAAILWLLIPGPFALRRLLRLRRGLCPKCAYPMGESAVCSECGGALAKKVAT